MIYIKSVFADQHLFLPSIRMHEFRFQPFLTCHTHIYMDLPVRQKLDLRQPTQRFKAFHFRLDVFWFELFLRNINQ